MDQPIRNKLRSVVTQCRKLLEDSTAQALQGRFGIYAARKKGEVQIEDEVRMAHLTKEDYACRQDLLDHLEHIQAIGYKPSEALEQLVREIAFTHLNRLCAYKVMEARGLIREAVSRGLQSQGLFFYLSDHPEDEKLHNGGRQEAAYRNFLDWLGGTLSEEIGVLFNPNDPANRIYPPQRVLDEVLALINDGELSGIWSQDETTGWVYQYFTPKELRDKARKKSQAPRNSYELAFRNQFFTPRYVVEFLTDNTLGRIWYEMRKGETSLKERCRYLVRRPTEIFLKEGEEPPVEAKEARDDLSQEELLKQPVYIPHRPKKDPREIKVIDPACGSGHFLLYCFDLLQVIYEEAFDDPGLGAALRKDYPALEDLRRDVPGLILKHNLHGIDIDLRATQIAALALWLRCQRAYQELGLKNSERPKITRSNIVCAEPMPGEEDMRREFVKGLDDKLGQLVSRVFDRMKLAGEAGSLLKIEEEIVTAIREIYGQYGEMFRESDEQRWMKAEDDLLKALREYTERAENGRGFRRRLFAEDASRGFSFIDVCRKKYDVVLMNPPLTDAPSSLTKRLKSAWPASNGQLGPLFVMRFSELMECRSVLGTVINRPPLFIQGFEDFRCDVLLRTIVPLALLDLGEGDFEDVIVEVAAIAAERRLVAPEAGALLTYRLLGEANKSDALRAAVAVHTHSLRFETPVSLLRNVPKAPFCYWLPLELMQQFQKCNNLLSIDADVDVGLSTKNDPRHVRSYWEVPNPQIGIGRFWAPYDKGGEYSPFFFPVDLVVRSHENFKELHEELCNKFPYLKGNTSWVIHPEARYGSPGASFQMLTTKDLTPRVMPSGCVFYIAIIPNSPSKQRVLLLVGFFNSAVVRVLVDALVGGGGGTLKNYEKGTILRIPVPNMTEQDATAIVEATQRAVDSVLNGVFRYAEPASCFCGLPVTHGLREASRKLMEAFAGGQEELKQVQTELDAISYRSFDLSLKTIEQVESLVRREDAVGNPPDVMDVISRYASLWVGIVFGWWPPSHEWVQGSKAQWDIDKCRPEPRSMNSGPAILLDDPEHEDDIVRRVRDVLEVIWKDRAEAIEKEACEILGVRELRDYFRKPGNGGFWMDHVKRYSKSRRKAPIYWYLRSAKGNYGLWLYYHRLDKDILFKALLNYVEPKIRLEDDRLKTLRTRKEKTGSSGRETKHIEKDMDRQEQFVSELRDFADKLRRAANLHLTPDLNDGVVLNIAPLWELAPWKEAKEYWEELIEGKYEWSGIGKQLHAKGIMKV